MNNTDKIRQAQERIGKDDGLCELVGQRNTIDMQIISRRRELQKKEGLVVNSLDELKCEKHPNSKYEFLEHLHSSDDVKVYVCSDCKSEYPVILSHIPGGLILSQSGASVAHDCPACDGIVNGPIRTEEYTSSKESWMSLAGREGEHYHCNLCNTQLGSHYWKFS